MTVKFASRVRPMKHSPEEQVGIVVIEVSASTKELFIAVEVEAREGLHFAVSVGWETKIGQ